MAAIPDPKPRRGRTFVADFLASLVVFMVSLPLCIVIAQACGLPPEAGIITASSRAGGRVPRRQPLQCPPGRRIIVLVITFLDDAKAQAPDTTRSCSGPRDPASRGDQIAAGALKIGQWFRAVSPAVVR